MLTLLSCLISSQLVAQTISDGRYVIYNRNSGLALDISGVSKKNVANVHQWKYKQQDNQKFEIAAQGDGYYSIKAVHSGKSLDVASASKSNGANVQQYTYWGGSNQLFSISEVSTGNYAITVKHSGLLLGVKDGSTSQGGDVRQYNASGGYEQQWQFVPVDFDCTTGPADEGLYKITNYGSGLSLDVESGSGSNGANIQQWGYSGGNHQQFYLRSADSGYWLISPASKAGSTLDVEHESKKEGENIHQWSIHGRANQQWKLSRSSATGSYQILSKNSGLALTAENDNSGGNIYQSADNSSSKQRWNLTPLNFECSNSSSNDSSSDFVVDGFAAQTGDDGLSTTTGGRDATPVVVTSCDAMVSALADDDAKVIHIPDNTTINCHTSSRSVTACAVKCPTYLAENKYTYRIPVGTQTCEELDADTNKAVTKTVNTRRIHVKSNKTLLGLGSGSKVTGASFILTSSKNVIFKNFTLEDVNPGLIEAGGGIYLNEASHVWVDHMRFRDISDGYVDMTSAKNVTLSWNHFDGEAEAISCDDKHPFIMFADNSLVTYHHNFYDSASGRNPKLNKSNTRAHLYNNYWKDISYFCTAAENGAQAKVEANYYQDSSRPHWTGSDKSGYIDADTDSNRYTGISATGEGRDTGASVFSDVTLYNYSLDDVDNLPTSLTNNTGPQ
jgi:pectate lyase